MFITSYNNSKYYEKNTNGVVQFLQHTNKENLEFTLKLHPSATILWL